jgi:hypothetical protein
MEVRKRLYLGLLCVTLLLLAGSLAYIWLTLFRQGSSILRYFSAAAVMVVLVVLLVIGLGFFGIVISLLSDRNFRILEKPMHFTVAVLYPLVIRLGRMFKIAQDRIQRSFVEVNNQLVRARKTTVVDGRLLLLLPHCLQGKDCTRRITANPDSCSHCGECSVSDLLRLGDRHGIPLRIATGGTLARQAVQETRPQAIVAVACERDLTSGILDAIPLPVLGVTNERPFGPCHNTSVNLEAVEKAILFFKER